MEAVTQLSDHMGVQPACEALCVSRAGFYRRQHAQPHQPERNTRPRPPLALAGSERQEVLERLLARDIVERVEDGIQFEIELTRQWWVKFG